MGKETQMEFALEEYFGTLIIFFIMAPVLMMFVRLITRAHHEGLMAMFTPPVDLDPSKRRLSSRLRVWLYQRTQYGFYIDVAQAACSGISCLLYIAVSYMTSEPEWVTDVEDFFTVYFAVDYGLRLYIAQDSFRWYFSLVSLLDFATVVPAMTFWLLTADRTYDTSVVVVMQAIRVFRVFRIFRVIRVVRLLSVSANYAFQRQVFVLIMTVVSLVFAAAGLFQIFESDGTKEYPFHRAVYYAAVTVIGRPAVGHTATSTTVFLTIVVALAATIIPTFVAELIRLWYDNASLETYIGNPETPHVIVCGDTNVSRLRSIVQQYFHKSRDPETQTPIVILAEAKPEGALRLFVESYRHSGIVRYIRGSARRAGDLRRAAVTLAKTVIVLNYRSDKDAAASDTEVLSTVMAVKNVVPTMRVLAQLYRPRKRNHLKAVPGWQDGDKSVSSIALGMTLVGLGARIPGASTLVTNLIRRGVALAGLPPSTLASKALPWWYIMMYGDAAKPASSSAASTSSTTHIATAGIGGLDIPAGAADAAGRAYRARTPIEEYAASIDQALFEVEVTTALVGRTFSALARVAYLRYGITLIGATVPVNEDIMSLVPGLPRTYRLVLFPAACTLAPGQKLYVIAPHASAVERFRVEHGGSVKSMMQKAMETVGSAFVVGSDVNTAGMRVTGSAGSSGSVLANVHLGGSAAAKGGMADEDSLATSASRRGGFEDGFAAVSPENAASSSASSPWSTGNGHVSASAAAATAAAGGNPTAGPSTFLSETLYHHNAGAVADLAVPWCFCEAKDTLPAIHADSVGDVGLLHKLHLDRLAAHSHAPAGGDAGAGGCASCGRGSTRVQAKELVTGAGIVVLAGGMSYAALQATGGATGAPLAGVSGSGIATATPAVAAAPAAPSVTVSDSDFDFDAKPAATAAAPAAADAASDAAVVVDAASTPAAITAAASPTVDYTIGAATPSVASGTPSATVSPAAAVVVASGAGGGLSSRPLLIPRRNSIGDDGLGGVDDTDDITGLRGPLATVAPSFNSSSGIASTARAAARANINGLAVRLALPVTSVSDVESLAADALDTLQSSKYKGHVLICGVNDNIGYLLRAIAALISSGRRAAAGASTDGFVLASSATAHVEGEQYDLQTDDIVILASAKPSDAAVNAMYQGSSLLLSRVTFITGSPSEASDLLKAGVMTARAAIVLSSSKPTAAADGGDNLTDDADAVVTTAIIGKLNPGLHTITELLHGAHAPFTRPGGASLHDACRGALIAILEEREASRQRNRLEDAIKKVALEREITTAPTSAGAAAGAMEAVPVASSRIDILLSKLYRQQARLRAAMTGTLVFRPSRAITFVAAPRGAPGAAVDLVPVTSAGAPAAALAGGTFMHLPVHAMPATNYSTVAATTAVSSSSGAGAASIGAAVDALESNAAARGVRVHHGGPGGSAMDAELEQLAESGLSNTAIVDVLVGVREDFGGAAAAANDGAAFTLGGAGGAGGASKGSGATNDLFASPAFAAGRVFSFNVMDAITVETLFEPFIVSVLKQLVRAGRKHRFAAVPITEAVLMTRLAMPGSPYSAGGSLTPAAVAQLRDHYMSQLAHSIIDTARGRGAAATATDDDGAGAAGPSAWMDAPVRTYGQLFEGLLRGWNMLPIGLYRRVHPATGLRANPQTAAALQLAAGPPTQAGAFVNNKALVSYVFTNPSPDAVLSEHDMVYVLMPENAITSSGFSDVRAHDDDGADV